MTTKPCPPAPWRESSPARGRRAVVVIRNVTRYIPTWLKVVVLALSFLCIGCTAYAGPPGTAERISFDPPAVYWLWLDEVGECSGLDGTMGAMRFYVVPDRYIEGVTGELLGRYDRGDVYLSALALRDEGTVKHEFLHAMGVKGHPVPPFVTCAPL